MLSKAAFRIALGNLQDSNDAGATVKSTEITEETGAPLPRVTQAQLNMLMGYQQPASHHILITAANLHRCFRSSFTFRSWQHMRPSRPVLATSQQVLGGLMQTQLAFLGSRPSQFCINCNNSSSDLQPSLPHWHQDLMYSFLSPVSHHSSMLTQTPLAS